LQESIPKCCRTETQIFVFVDLFFNFTEVANANGNSLSLASNLEASDSFEKGGSRAAALQIDTSQ